MIWQAPPKTGRIVSLTQQLRCAQLELHTLPHTHFSDLPPQSVWISHTLPYAH